MAAIVLLATLLAGCGGGSAPRADAPPPATALPSAARTGILVTRPQGIVLRSAEDGAEAVIIPVGLGTLSSHPRWSPSGDRVAFVRTTYPAPGRPDWGADVVVLRLDGSGERTVLKHARPGMAVEGIAWSPDGGSLYVSTLDPNTPGSLKLARLDLATGALASIADGAAFPAVSPDGSQIAYLTYSSGPRPGGLWLANADGSGPRQLLAVPGMFAGLRGPRFSPDGRTIAFGGVEPSAANEPAPTCPSGRRWPWQPRTASAHGPPVSVWLQPVDGGPPRRVSGLVEDDPALAWSPDGARLAVLGACGLYEVAVDTGEARKVGPGAVFSQIDWR